jgi:hypothetical protein
MRGGSRRRFCEACQHDVVNLSALTEREAAEIVARAGAERVCVRYESNEEGRVHFRPEPGALSPALKERIAAGALATLTRAAAPLIPVSALLPGCATLPDPAPVLPAPAPPAAVAPAPCPLPVAEDNLVADPSLGPNGALTVVVKDTISGAPVADTVVTLESASLQHQEVGITDQEGKFILAGLPPAGDYHLRIEATGYRPYARTLAVSPGQSESLVLKLVPEPLDGRLETVGVLIVVQKVDVGSAAQGVRVDQTFLSRIPLR